MLFLIHSHTKANSSLEEYVSSLDTSRLSLCVYSIIYVHKHFDFLLICQHSGENVLERKNSLQFAGNKQQDFLDINLGRRKHL